MLLLPALTAPFLGVELTPLWTMQSLVPAADHPAGAAGRPSFRARRPSAIAASVLAITMLALLAAPVAAWTRHV